MRLTQNQNESKNSTVCMVARFPNRTFCGGYLLFQHFDLRYSLCRNFMTMHAKRRYHVLTQSIRTIKTFNKYKKVLLLINLPQNTKSDVKCCDHRDKIKTTTQINHKYLASTTHNKHVHFSIFCVCKIEIAEKIK